MIRSIGSTFQQPVPWSSPNPAAWPSDPVDTYEPSVQPVTAAPPVSEALDLDEAAPSGLAAEESVGAGAQGMGAIGLLGGAVQALYGLGEVEQGQTLDGGCDMVGGTAAAIGGGMAMAGAIPGACIAGGASAMIGGFKDIADGHTGRGLLKSAAGAVMMLGTVCPPLGAVGGLAYGLTSLLSQ